MLDVGHAIPVSRGSAAIFLALRDAGIDPEWEVLVPAYHCLSMIEPILALGAKPVYVRVTEDLALDLGDAEKRLSSATRGMLAAHFFGFYQNMHEVHAFCEAHGLLLIEDCAHAFFGRFGKHRVGEWGDYVVASARKFFPIADGGFLVSARKSLSAVRPSDTRWVSEVKAFMDVLEEAFRYTRLPFLRLLTSLPLGLKRWIWARVKGVRAASEDSGELGPGVTEGYEYVDVRWLDKSMTRVSQWLLRSTSTERITESRRRNYALLVEGLSNLAGGRPLWPTLPQGVVPYMLPFLIERPEIVFPALKQIGMPLYRWDKLASDCCPVSNRYSRELLQLPCHQELTERELASMIECVRGVLQENARPRR